MILDHITQRARILVITGPVPTPSGSATVIWTLSMYRRPDGFPDALAKRNARSSARSPCRGNDQYGKICGSSK